MEKGKGKTKNGTLNKGSRMLVTGDGARGRSQDGLGDGLPECERVVHAECTERKEEEVKDNSVSKRQ